MVPLRVSGDPAGSVSVGDFPAATFTLESGDDIKGRDFVLVAEGNCAGEAVSGDFVVLCLEELFRAASTSLGGR